MFASTSRTSRLCPLFAPLAAVALLSGSPVVRADDVNYEKIVDVLRIDLVAPKKKTDNPTIAMSFNLHPRLPKGAKIEFQLYYQFQQFESEFYTLSSENRKNLKFEWTPKKHLPVDDAYQIRTQLPLASQTASVAKEIGERKESFPPESEPWSWNYPNFAIKVGTEDDKKAQELSVKKYFAETIGKLLDLNNEFIDELTLLEGGEKYVDGTKLDTEAFSTFVDGWMKKFGELQLAISEYESKEPGLFRKHQAAHYQLQRLSRLVAKRCYAALRDGLEKKGATIAQLKLKGHKGFNRNERGRVTPTVLGNVYDAINALIGFEDVLEPPPEEKDDEAAKAE